MEFAHACELETTITKSNDVHHSYRQGQFELQVSQRSVRLALRSCAYCGFEPAYFDVLSQPDTYKGLDLCSLGNKAGWYSKLDSTTKGANASF